METLARLQLARPASSVRVWAIFIFLCVYNLQRAFLPLHMFIHFVHSLFFHMPSFTWTTFLPHCTPGLWPLNPSTEKKMNKQNFSFRFCELWFQNLYYTLILSKLLNRDTGG